MMHGYGGGHGWGMGWGMGFGWIIGLVVLIFIIWIIVRVVNNNKGTGRSDKRSPVDILKERYARGEIDKKEFDERKKDLM